jgi:hypothetical protein
MIYDLKDKEGEEKACSTGTPNAKGLRLGARPAPGGDPLTPAEGGWATCFFRVLSAEHATQTQSLDCGLRIWHRPAAGRPVRATGPGAGCTNKPNSARSRRGSPYKQTQFSGHGRDGRGTHGRSRPCYGTHGGVTTNRASAPNKPNLGAGDLEDKYRVNKELRPIGCTSGPRKTKPIQEKFEV